MVVIAVGMLAAMYARACGRSIARPRLSWSKWQPSRVEPGLVRSLRRHDTRLFPDVAEITAELAERLVQDATRQAPEYDPRQQAPGAAWCPRSPPGCRARPAAGKVPRKAWWRITQISLQPVRNTQLVKLSFDSHDPQLAERVPNTLAMIYIIADLEARRYDAALDVVSQRSGSGVEAEVNESERAQDSRAGRIVVAKGVAVSAIRQLEEIESALTMRARNAWMRRRFNQVKGAAGPAGRGAGVIALVQNNRSWRGSRKLEAERREGSARPPSATDPNTRGWFRRSRTLRRCGTTCGDRSVRWSTAY